MTTAYNRLSRFLVVLGTATLSGGTPVAREDGVPSDTDSGITVELSLPQTAFRGLPCLGTVYVHRRPRDPAVPKRTTLGMSEEERKREAAEALSRFSGFAEFDLLKAYLPLGVEIADAQTKTVQKTIRPDRGASLRERIEIEPPWAVRPKQATLSPGETRALLIDFGAWLVDIADGRYAVSIELHNLFGKEIAKSKQAPIELRSLPDEVWTAIDSFIPQLTRDGPIPRRWDWLKTKMHSRQLQDQLPKEVFSQLALYCFLSDVAHEGKIEKAPTELLDNVPGHLGEFAAALRYEVLLAKGEKDAAKKLKDVVLSKSTAMKWRFDDADAGNGLLQQVIKRIFPTVRRQ